MYKIYIYTAIIFTAACGWIIAESRNEDLVLSAAIFGSMSAALCIMAAYQAIRNKLKS